MSAGFCYNSRVKRDARGPGITARSAAYIVGHLAMIFFPAGGFGYPQGWAFFSVLLAAAAVHLSLLARDPGLERERSSPGKGVKTWDSFLAPAAQWSVYAAIFVSAAERGYRGDAGDFLTAAAVPGLLFYAAGNALFLYAMASNRFFSSISRIQSERGHFPQDGGPYRWVRHPGYAGACLQLAGIPAALGSAVGAVPALAGILLFVIRTRLEDGMLIKELPGYRDYARRVGSRLLPGVW